MSAKTYGPGPGAYMLPPTVGYEHHDPSRWRNPQFSMRPRYTGVGKAVGPGPAYHLEHMTRVGKSSPPAYSMSSRHKPPGGLGIPGPGAYSPELVPRMKEPRPPVYSMQRRYGLTKGGMTPGPNQYLLPSCLGPRVPNKPSAAAYSMSGKHGLTSKGATPGPAAYGDLNSDVNKPRQPAYSIAGRCPIIGNKTKTPGPAAYLPIDKECVPHYSFGVRHVAMPLITPEDNMACVRK